MDLCGSNILLVGLARTGISTIKKLKDLGANIIVNDIKKEKELVNILNDLDKIKIKYVLGKHIEDVKNIDLAIVSPGVPLELPFIQRLIDNNIEVIGEIELTYRLSNSVFVGITGTNGKTTTTTLVGEIFKTCKKKTFVVGNIGNPAIDTIGRSDEESVLVTELSSFQLESVKKFKTSVCAILNITPDHLNRHKTMENYIAAKCNIFKNQTNNDYTILNYDCSLTRELASKSKGKIIFFSRKVILSEGIYIDNDNIIIKNEKTNITLMNKNEIKIPGNHNLENSLAAIAIAFVSKLDMQVVKQILKSFGGVEHRLEFVREINGVKYINDSKGTNPDASMKAIESYNDPIVLIAGGMDKKSDFSEFIKALHGKVIKLILLGETADIIQKIATENGITNCTKVCNMKEAVNLAHKSSKSGYVVLLSPACASWDMYESFEVRGEDFKNEVFNL